MSNPSRRKLFLIFHGRFPGEKAAALFAAKSAESFAEKGIDVTVLAPRRLGRSRLSPKEFFGTKDNFRTVYLPTVDLFKWPAIKRFAFIISYLTFSKWTFFYLLFKAKKGDLIYSNELLPLLYASFWFRNIYFEIHDFPKKSFLSKIFFLRLKLAIVTNRWKKNEIAKLFAVSESKLLCEPNAVDLERFRRAKSDMVQGKLDLSVESKLVGYVGALKTMENEKGIGTLLEALKLLPANFHGLIIGGNREETKAYREVAGRHGLGQRIVFTGWVRHYDVPEYLAACDVLVAPFPNTPHYNLYMSPMKIFEYMASGKPIVASDLNSIREILPTDAGFLVKPESPEELARAIRKVVEDKKETEAKTRRAFEIVKDHTWQKRAERILKAIS